MKKYVTPKIQVYHFTDRIATAEVSPLSEIYAAGSTNSVIMNGAKAQRTTTADIKDILEFK